MAPEEYELLKGEIPDIANMIKSFPEELQKRVFDLLVSTLLGHPVSLGPDEAEKMVDSSESEIPTDTKPRNYVEEFKKFVEEKDPKGKLADLEFAAVVAEFYIHRAPEEKRVEEITEVILQEGFKLSNRKPPGNPKSTLGNSKSKRGYLDKGVNGGYVLTAMGEHFVKNELPKKG